MARPGEQPQLHEHVPAQLRLGQHSSNRVHQHVIRLLRQPIGCGHFFAATGETTEPLIKLGCRFRGEVRNRRVIHLPSRKPHALDIDHDHVIAAIDVRRVIRLVLAHQDGRDFGR